MNIGVATTAWGGYGRWLPDWVASVARQQLRPSLVTVVVCGGEDAGPVREALEDSGLEWQIIADTYRGMGAARNRAIEATPTEWVMHLDADDVLLPHCLSDVKALSRRADVVSVGMIRDGRPVVFPHVTRQTILRGRQGTFSCAAFRRSLWERQPYLTANDWIDSALWVGYAHLGARFVGGRRPGAVYRQHDTSYSRTLTAADRAAAREQWRRLCRRWEP